jgi:CRP/FNR family transcriptional regulator
MPGGRVMLEVRGPSVNRSPCELCALRERPLCMAQNTGRWPAAVSRISVPVGAVVAYQGDDAKTIGTVVAGILKLVKTLPDGRQQIVGFVHPGELFGRPHAEQSDCAIEAATDVALCVSDRHAYERAMAIRPELEHQVLLLTLADLAEARTRELILGCQTTQERIASFLLITLRRRLRVIGGLASPGQVPVVALKISRKDLASYLSTSIETISRTLHQFADKRIIGLLDHEHFAIRDVDGLKQLCGLAAEDLDIFAEPSTKIAAPQMLVV